MSRRGSASTFRRQRLQSRIRDRRQLLRGLGSFLLFERTFNGGVFVSTGDLDGDGRADIITGAGATTANNGGQGPLVSLFDDRMWAEIDCFFVDDTDTTQGIWVGGSPRQRR